MGKILIVKLDEWEVKKANAEGMSPNLLLHNKLKEKGANKFNGALSRKFDEYTNAEIFKYRMTHLEFLTMRFDIGYVPPYKTKETKRREILNRKF